jgi:hypothetical protein
MAIPSPTEVYSVASYLNSHSIPFDSVTPLSGGFTNYIFLISHATRPAFVLKHSSTNIKAFPSMSASVDRADCEVRALRIVPDLLRAAHPNTKAQEAEPMLDLEDALNVHLPVLLHYDAVSHVQHLVPCGVRTLKDAYSDASLDIAGLGRRLGGWLARLHAVRAVPDDFANNTVGQRVSGSGYRNAPGVLDAAGLDSESFRRTVARYEKMLNEDIREGGAGALCHGDFWHGNVLLPAGSEEDILGVQSHGEARDKKADEVGDPSTVTAEAASAYAPRLTVLDWEMSRRGNGATDVGQFAAEAWLLDTFRGGRGLLRAFLSGYAEEWAIE